ncbi:hypothetical protein [Chitinophaga sp. YIM B06452]|uniref:hypothetical protein n=1 Tax=Chitinophaga sp. YIM B06452 TaxID=3082158 RepID=UPI0031FE4CD3
MKNSLTILAVLLVSGCMTQKKWAEGCAERFPVKESTVYVKGEILYDTTYLAPDTLVFCDTVIVNCDTVKGRVTKYVYNERLCPPPAIVTRHQLDTLKITKVDSAAVRVAQIEAKEQRQRADRVTGGRDTWRGIAIVCLLMIGAAIFSKIKGFI